MSAWKTLIDRLSGTLGIEDDGGFPGEPLRQMFDISVMVPSLAGDGDAASTLANTKFWSNSFSYPVQIVAASVNADAAVTGDANDHATISLLVDDGAAGTPVAAASVTSDDNDWAAHIDEAMTLVPANCVVAAGANVFYAQAKGGSGVDLPVRTIKMRLRRA